MNVDRDAGRIPKRIYYCWFGKHALPKTAQKCMRSWKKYCPDYEIVCINEDNFDVNIHPYCKYHYEKKHFAHVSDYARLYFPAMRGGVYFDIDVELIKPIDSLLDYEAFYSMVNIDFGAEKGYVSTGQGYGTVANHPVVMAMLKEYDMLVPDSNGTYEMITAGVLNTKALHKLEAENGVEISNERTNILGAEILSGDYTDPFNDLTGEMKTTSNTFSIHWRSKTWIPRHLVLRSVLTRPIHRMFGIDVAEKIKSKLSGRQ